MSADLYRGGYRLPWPSQSCGVDFDALRITRHHGGVTTGVSYMLAGRRRYTIYSPESAARWQDFDSREDMQVWLDAYGCTADPEASRIFTVHFPAAEAAMQPLRTAEMVSV